MKYCSTCGKEISDENGFCPNCGVNGISSNNALQMPAKGLGLNQNRVSIALFVFAGLILILSLVACFKIMGGANELSDLTSQAGNTIAEAYYNECGTVYGGFAFFSLAFGLFASGLIAYLGYKNLNK